MPKLIRPAKCIRRRSRLATLRKHPREPEDAVTGTSILGRVWIEQGVSPFRRWVRDRPAVARDNGRRRRLVTAIGTSWCGGKTTIAPSASVPQHPHRGQDQAGHHDEPRNR
jgi:hypothetical protein